MSSFEQKGNKLNRYSGDDTEISIQDGIEHLDNYLFSNAHNLKKISLPKSVKRIEANMFPTSQYGAISLLETIMIDEDNPLYKSKDGVVYNKDMTKLIAFPAGSKVAQFIVPDTVREISESAFQGCNNLKVVKLPNGCETIGEYAFYSCENLTNINLNQVRELGAHAFGDCKSLKSVELDNVFVVKDSTFHGCWKLHNVRLEKVETIENAAFADCKVENLHLPNTLKTIHEYAFCGRGSVAVPESVEKIGMCALEDFQEITIYDNLRGRVSEMGKPYGYATGFSYDVFVKSAEDGTLKYVIPMHCDGTYKMYNWMMSAWGNDNSFGFESLDRHFKSIQKPYIKTKIAMTRLSYPYNLTDEAKKVYETYLKRNAVGIVEQFIDGYNDDAAFTYAAIDFSPHIKHRAFELASTWGLLKKTNIDELIEYAQKKECTEWVAFLLDWKAGNAESNKGTLQFKPESYMVGDAIAFGHYDFGAGDVPMEWVIVDATKKQYLLLSKYLVKEMPFYSGKHVKYQYIGWSKSDVRKWLNDEFYSTSFDMGERERICQKKLKNINDDDTEDYLFIPSEKEFMKYVEIPRLVEDKLGFRYGSNGTPYDSEMLRKTWMRYSSCCIEVRTSHIWSITNKPSYMHQRGDVTEPLFIRPMMWISLIERSKSSNSSKHGPKDAEKRQRVSDLEIETPEKPEAVKKVHPIDYEMTILKGKTFSVAGFSEEEESEIAKSVELNGGIYLYNFSSGLNYLIYNPDCDSEPLKMKKAKILKKKGEDISFITINEFMNMLSE